jgi:hypothetical protein
MSRQQRAYLAACVREGRPMSPEEREQAAKLIETSGRPTSPDALDRRFVVAEHALRLLDSGLTVKAVHNKMRDCYGVSSRYVDKARAERLRTDRELRAAMAGFDDFRRAVSKHFADIMANLERLARESRMWESRVMANLERMARESRGSKYSIHRGRLVVLKNSAQN